MYFTHNTTKVRMRPDYILPSQLGGDGVKTVAQDLGYTDEQTAAACLEFDRNTAIELRKSEYPPITDYIDGVVKGDQAQIDAYIAACQAVKAKYPKV
jgi:hypothetical protein